MAANHTINEPSSTPRALARLLLLTAASLLIASCSGGSDASATPTVQLTSTAPTTVATTTTTEATTTTEDPAIAHERDVAEITEVYGLLVNSFERLGLNQSDEQVAEFATDPFLSTRVENMETLVSQGFKVGQADSGFRLIEAEIDGDIAHTTTCELDGSSILTEAGEVVYPADVEWTLWVSELHRLPQGWRVAVSNRQNGEFLTCDAS